MKERSQMANGKGQMANGLRSLKWQISNHLNFAICYLPSEMFVPTHSLLPTADCLLPTPNEWGTQLR
jgi:hypothetical protein